MFANSLTALRAAEIAAGTRFESFTVGTTLYRDVQIRSINARTVMITHTGGMSSIKLRDLSPEWQTKFGYDPAAEAAAEQAARPAPVSLPNPATSLVAPRAERTEGTPTLDRLLKQFGQPATIATEVDLRPKFFQLELIVKSQGRRPSCAVFAVVSALEFQSAELTGKPEKLSEEYLSWATRKTIQRIPSPDPVVLEDTPLQNDDADEGFSLSEVVAALRGYGIPLQSSMPNRFGRAIAAIEDPPGAVIEEAQNHQRVSVLAMPGRDNVTRINNLVHALNAGVPVPVGMAWPNSRSIRSGTLSAQQPMPDTGHAVTLVGYRSPGGRIDDVVFIFKNSWGVDWGQGGYGNVTYGYLLKHLQSAVLLDIQRG